MFKRMFFVAAMGAAIGVPYLATSSGDWWKSLVGGPSATPPQTATSGPASHKDPAGALATAATAHAPTNPLAKAPRAIEGFGAQDLGEVLQFEGTPAWVMARWPRVTAGLSELDLQGYRVPLVSGTHDDDLAGSLTYYFDKQQRVAHISFHGTTGDPRKIIALVTSRYSFRPQTTDDPSLQLYQVKWNGKATSELRIRPAHVLRADQPRARYEVDLAMKRP